MNTILILMAISSIVIILFPIIFAVVVGKVAYGKTSIFFIGLAGYLVANFGLNSIINLAIGSTVENLYETNKMLADLIDCLQQGFVEEIMRFLLMLLCMKNSLQKENSLMYAAGHGGLEMMIRGAGIAVGVVMSIMNPEEGMFDDDIPIFAPFLSPILFICIFCFQIGLTYLVFRSVKDKKYPLVILAIALHALANFSTALELPVVSYLIPAVIVIGLMVYTIISYRNDTKMDFYD